MRTTVDLPDELMKKAKIKAVEEEITFKELIIRALKNEIDKTNEASSDPWNDLKGSGTASALKANHSGFES